MEKDMVAICSLIFGIIGIVILVVFFRYVLGFLFAIAFLLSPIAWKK